jgi:DNA modification methylase
MKTTHQVLFATSADMADLPSASVDLVVTSPPYPMIAMWDEMFAQQDSHIAPALAANDGCKAFEQMHRVLDRVWAEVARVLKPGGFTCINIGDATRSLAGEFRLYPNHARIADQFGRLGFTVLPSILWRKPTNAPTKFMGSGMLPAGAYVTLEHEHILVFRKGSKREFKTVQDKRRRHQSAIFWEERNAWYSDVWFDVRGSLQALASEAGRPRSAAFPFEIPYRLINMYSVKEDMVLDPFWGTGTTTIAAMTAGRHSIGYEIDRSLDNTLDRIQGTFVAWSHQCLQDRLTRHIEFAVRHLQTGGRLKHINQHYGFPVMTAQEKELLFNAPLNCKHVTPHRFEVTYDQAPQAAFRKNWQEEFPSCF